MLLYYGQNTQVVHATGNYRGNSTLLRMREQEAKFAYVKIVFVSSRVSVHVGKKMAAMW